MKITGTPTADFVVKLQSQDVRCSKDIVNTRSQVFYEYMETRGAEHAEDWFLKLIYFVLLDKCTYMFRECCYPFNRPETTSEVYPKCQKKICTPFLPKLAQMVRGNLCSPVYPAAGSAKVYHTDFDVSFCPPPPQQ